jgi:hypothetical protein
MATSVDDNNDEYKIDKTFSYDGVEGLATLAAEPLSQDGVEGAEPLSQDGVEGAEPLLDTSWLDNFKQAESNYNDFYKEPVHSITIFLLYVNKENELEHLHTDKCLLSEDGLIKRDIILSFIKQYQLLFTVHYKLLSLLKYNINLEPTDINEFINEDTSMCNNRFLTSEKYLNDIHYDDSIHMFQDLNALFFIFYEEKDKTTNNAQTKRVKLSSHSKTKRNNKDIKKNLKIKKQVS